LSFAIWRRTAEIGRVILDAVLKQIDYKTGKADGPSMVARMLAGMIWPLEDGIAHKPN
jgi:hypothetical protein